MSEGYPLQVKSIVLLGGSRPAGVLKLFFVYVNGNVGIPKMLKTTGMVEMHMAHHNRGNIFNVVTCGFDGFREPVLLFIHSAGK